MKFIPNPSSRIAIQRSPGMAAFLKAHVEAAAEYARSVAPEESGDYKDGIKSDVGITGNLAVGTIYGEDWKTIWLERGTSQQPALAILRRGADAAGIKIVVSD
jgi:hypothetical protein